MNIPEERAPDTSTGGPLVDHFDEELEERTKPSGRSSSHSNDAVPFPGTSDEEGQQVVDVDVRGPFSDPVLVQYWRDVYEKSGYECRHHLDPEFTWEPEEERKLVRWTDWYVTFWAFLMYTGLNIDRYNVTNATAGTFLEDLGLTEDDYNLGTTINLICFLAAELPSQLVSKKIGPDWWVPIQLLLWSAVSMSQAALSGRASFLATRCLIGALEGGFIADVILWMSYFYKNHELLVRVAYFYISVPFTQILTGLLSAAIFLLDGKCGLAGWRWLFLLEGAITVIIGLASFFKMPASVVQTRAWYNCGGWYNEREEKIMVNRVLRDDPSKGDMSNREAITPWMLWKSLIDYDLWPLYFTRLMVDILYVPLSRYSALIIKTIIAGKYSSHVSAVINSLLQVPYEVLTATTMVIASHLARHFRQYGFVVLFSPLWLLPCLAAMRWWPGFLNGDEWASYMLLFMALGYPPSYAIMIGWTSENSNSVRTRSVSAALVNMFSQAGAMIGSNLFRASDAPRYPMGLEVDFALSCVGIAAVIGCRYYFVIRNRKRDEAWNNMSSDEQREYTTKTTDEGNKRLDFRFAY